MRIGIEGSQGGSQTLEGSTVKIKANKQGVRVDKANVIATDILATNGVIHVIDEVLMPSK